MNARTRIIAIALAVAALALGCAKKDVAGGKLVFAITGDIAALDPAFAYDFTTNPVVNEITEGLLRFSPSGELLPNLAESWENPDSLTYVYHLRKGVKFHDGTPLTAADVVFSLNRIRDSKTASPLAWMFGSVADIAAVDEGTVKITLSKSDAQFKYSVATTAGHVIPKAFYEKSGADFGKPAAGLVGTGPFKFKSWAAGSEVVLERNAAYWDAPAKPTVETAVFKIISEDATRVAGLKTGEIDATVNLPLDLIPVVSGLDNVAVQGVEGFTDDWIAFNTEKAPMSDPNVRKAIIHAFKVQDVMDTVVKDAGVTAKNQPVGPALWFGAVAKWEAFQASVEDYAFDLSKAKAYLAKSKYPKGFKASIVTDGNGFRVNVAQILQANLKELGIELAVEKVTDEELTSRQFSGKRDYDIIMGGWGSDYPDPAANVYPFLHSSNAGEGGSNFAVYKNAKVDALLDEQNTLADDSARADLLIKALTLASQDAPYIFVDHPKLYFAASKKVSGYTMSPVWYWDSILRAISKAK